MGKQKAFNKRRGKRSLALVKYWQRRKSMAFLRAFQNDHCYFCDNVSMPSQRFPPSSPSSHFPCSSINDRPPYSVITIDENLLGIISSDEEIESEIIPDMRHEEPTQELNTFSFMTKSPYDSDMEHELEVEKVKAKESELLQGYRIVDLRFVLQWAMTLQMDHRKKCTLGKYELIKELRLGLHSVLTFECDECGHRVEKTTEKPNQSTFRW